MVVKVCTWVRLGEDNGDYDSRVKFRGILFDKFLSPLHLISTGQSYRLKMK